MTAKTRITLLTACLGLAFIAMSCQLASGFLGGEDTSPTAAAPSADVVQPAPLETAAAPPAGK